jgi:hypothetical protein
MAFTKVPCRCFAAALLVIVAAVAACQDKHLVINEKFLPTLSQSKETNYRSPGTYPDKELKWFVEIPHDSDTEFLRLHLRVNQLRSDSGWKIRVLGKQDEKYSEIQVLSYKDFSLPSSSLQAWSRRIPGKVALVELLATGNIDGFELFVDRYNYQVSVPAEQAFVGLDEREDLVLVYGRDHHFYQWGVPIASVLFVTADTKKDSGCTAFLVSKDLLMTNEHCISQDWQLPTSQVVFGYESMPQKVEQFGLKELVAKCKRLDYSLLRLDRAADSWSTVSLDTGKSRVKEEKLILIQVPPAERKKIAVHKCKIEDPDARGVSDEVTDFYHLCDSEGGSSGSPVMDAGTGKVVGLHHAGRYDPKTNDNHNLGVRIELILKDIATRLPDVCKQIVGCSTN